MGEAYPMHGPYIISATNSKNDVWMGNSSKYYKCSTTEL